MMEPEEILELIHTAPEHYDSVRAALRYRGDGSVHKEIRERLWRSEAGRRAFRVSPVEARKTIQHPEPDGPFGWRCRAWYAGAYRERLETEVPGGGVNISAINGYMRFWRHRVGAGPREDDPPWFHLAHDHYWTFYSLVTDEICGISYELERLEPRVEEVGVRWAGREAVRLVVVPPVIELEWDPDPLSWGADEYEVVVDAERGVLLRCASWLRGKDLDALEVEEIHFDECLEEDVFTAREPLPWP